MRARQSSKNITAKSTVPFVIVEVKRYRDLSTTDDALHGMDKEPNRATIQHMPYLPTHHGDIFHP